MVDPIATDNQEDDEKNESCCEEEEPINNINLLISIGEGVKSCMRNSKYPISNYITYTKLSRNFKTFVSKGPLWFETITLGLI